MRKRRRDERTFADRLRSARRWPEVSQRGLAEQLGVSASAAAQWEAQGGTSPKAEHLAEIARVTGVAFEWLATGRGEPRVSATEAPAAVLSDFALNVDEER